MWDVKTVDFYGIVVFLPDVLPAAALDFFPPLFSQCSCYGVLANGTSFSYLHFSSIFFFLFFFYHSSTYFISFFFSSLRLSFMFWDIFFTLTFFSFSSLLISFSYSQSSIYLSICLFICCLSVWLTCCCLFSFISIYVCMHIYVYVDGGHSFALITKELKYYIIIHVLNINNKSQHEKLLYQ